VPAVEQAMPSDRRAVAYLHIVASDSVQLLYSCLDVVVVDVKDLECVEVDDQRLLVDGHSLGDVGHHVVDGGCVVGMATVKSRVVEEAGSYRYVVGIVGMVALTLEMEAMHTLKQPVDTQMVDLDDLGKLAYVPPHVAAAYMGCAALGF
jgi:hypothetical protein